MRGRESVRRSTTAAAYPDGAAHGCRVNCLWKECFKCFLVVCRPHRCAVGNSASHEQCIVRVARTVRCIGVCRGVCCVCCTNSALYWRVSWCVLRVASVGSTGSSACRARARSAAAASRPPVGPVAQPSRRSALRCASESPAVGCADAVASSNAAAVLCPPRHAMLLQHATWNNQMQHATCNSGVQRWACLAAGKHAADDSRRQQTTADDRRRPQTTADDSRRPQTTADDCRRPQTTADDMRQPTDKAHHAPQR
jgi:hypothetical protein